MSEIPSQNKVDVGLKFATTDWDKQVDTALLKQLVDERSKRGEGNPLTIITIEEETSLLRRLQAQTLPDATPPIGKIYPFSKMTVTFEPLMGF